ncbi:MAG: polysaccharide deacetylase family protein [Rhodothermales bacterium]|nr:polysaccharide deacetylase family protein [Rhodothermales bacterium]
MNEIKHSVRLLALALVFALGLPLSAGAQAVDATLTLAKPSPGVSHTVGGLWDSDEPRVALMVSDQARGLSTLETSRVRDAVYYWEVFLLGLQVPYMTVSDSEVAKDLSHKDYDLLIMPSSDALSGRQRKSILRFVDRGGSVIATGSMGRYDERGRDADNSFFAELVGAELVTRIPDQPFGLLHSVDAATPVGQGVPPGFRLNLAAIPQLTAARPVTGMALGTPYSYSGRDDRLMADLTLMMFNRVGDGAVLWTRFGPQDVSRERTHQAAYQRMMANAMAHLTGARSVSVRPWPELARSAVAVAALPTVGMAPLSYMSGWEEFLSLLQTHRVPATFFVTTDEALGFPDLVATMGQLGEVAIAAESDNVLLGQPLEVQAGRIARASGSLGGTQVGLYPPGGYHDGNTLRAAVEGGYNYVLLPNGQSLAPTAVRWWEDVDYRALQASATEQVDLAFLRSRRRQAREPQREAVAPNPAILMPLDPGVTDFVTRFHEVERAGGVYILPFHPESERAGSARTGELREVIGLAQERGTWMATVNEVLRWWTLRNAVSVDVVESEGDRFSIELNNQSREAVSGLTLELSLGDVGFDSLEGDLTGDLVAGDIEGTYLLVLDRVPTGTSRVTLNLF